MPRIPTFSAVDDVPAAHRPAAEAVFKVFGRIRGPFGVMLHSPKLAERMLGMVVFNREDCIVEGRLRSHAILAAVRECESAYVWSAQVGAARRAGVAEATIDLLRAKGDVSGLPEDERDVVNLTRQLARTHRVDYPVFNRLLAKYGVQWVVELVAATQYYAALAGITNAFEVVVPEDGDQLPS